MTLYIYFYLISLDHSAWLQSQFHVHILYAQSLPSFVTSIYALYVAGGNWWDIGAGHVSSVSQGWVKIGWGTGTVHLTQSVCTSELHDTHEFARISKYRTLSLYLHLYLTSLAWINRDDSNHDVHVYISFEHTCDIDIQSLWCSRKLMRHWCSACVITHQFPKDRQR